MPRYSLGSGGGMLAVGYGVKGGGGAEASGESGLGASWYMDGGRE